MIMFTFFDRTISLIQRYKYKCKRQQQHSEKCGVSLKKSKILKRYFTKKFYHQIRVNASGKLYTKYYSQIMQS